MQPLIDNFSDNSADALAERLDLLADRVATQADRLKVGGQRVACSALTATVLAGGVTAIALPTPAARAAGSTADVIALQQLLADNGFSPGAIDGVLGPATIAAIERAQTQLGLAVDGIAGPQTLAALSRGGAAFDLEDSAYVTQIQRLLTQNGFYDGPITGFYGPLTREAVTRAQAAYGLAQDGLAGPQTLAALQGGAPSTGTAAEDSTSIQQLQNLLTQRGFYTGPISGIYGPLTEAAVREAQRAYGLVVDGIAGPLTLAALRGGAPSTDTATEDSAGIQQLQNLLTQRGFYTGPISGIYGPLTEAAVRRAQAAYRLVVDGVAGSRTLAALRSGAPPVATVPTPTPTPAPTPTPPSQLSRAEILELQALLRRGEFYTGPIDGILGTQTRTAVAAVQRALQLVPDGQPTPTLLATLRQNVPAAGSNVAGGSGGSTPTPAPGGSGSNVSVSPTLELQQLLAQRDFYVGPLDGRNNEALTAAIRRAQNWYGLTPADGRPSSELIARLQTDRYAKVS